MEVLSLKSGFNLRSFEDFTSAYGEEASQIRNTELFPFLKERIVIQNDSCKPALSVDDTPQFLSLMGRVVP